MTIYTVIDKIDFGVAKSLLKVDSWTPGNFVFRLHYKWTVLLISVYGVVFSYVLGKFPISCVFPMVDKGDARMTATDYCWRHGVYSVVNTNPDAQIYPGVGPTTQETKAVKHHQYYQWVYFFVILSIILVSLPWKLWQLMERGEMKLLLGKSNLKLKMKDDEELMKDKKHLAEYLASHLGCHGKYAMGFVLCEFLNLAAVIFLITSLDIITGHEFSRHGMVSLDHITVPAGLRTDPLSTVFPIVGKCIFNRHGPGGDIVPYDGICVLPLNLATEHAAVFFWHYFMVLGAVGTTALAFRIVMVCSKSVREKVLILSTPLAFTDGVKTITDNCSYGDWFVIAELNKRLDPLIYKEVVAMFAEIIHQKHF